MTASGPVGPDRQQRSAEALRHNLRRRKEQARARSDMSDTGAANVTGDWDQPAESVSEWLDEPSPRPGPMGQTGET